MIEIELPNGFEDRLAALAAKKGRTKDYYVQSAIIDFVEDMENTCSEED